MKGLTLLVSILLALIFSTQAQEFRPGSILLGDELKEGLVQSDFKPGDDEVYFKANESAEVLSFTASTVKKVELTVKNSISITFAKERIFDSYGKAGEEVWLQQLIDGPISLYAETGADYLLFSNGNFMQLESAVSFYLKRQADEAVSLGGTFNKSAFNVNADRNFVKLTSDFLSDNRALCNRIRDREFGILEIPLVVDIYNSSAPIDQVQ